MGKLLQTFNDDIKISMRAKDEVKLGVLRMVKTAINNYIDNLPSNLHTMEDLTKLTEYISANCTNATVFCYGCIYTYPGQSEITITVNSSGTSIKKIIDITGHPYEKMRFANFHN